ncbi:MAG: aminotransferase class IV [Halioglobus sp.]|nr:aminotransferase class IV [Halioglobus sp.]
MSTAYLNGTYLPLSEARISPLDRGFLFGDGIYEVVPCHGGRLVGFDLHLERMQAGLNAVEIDVQLNRRAWQDIANRLVELNGGGNLAIYLHISRGADDKRDHAYPVDVKPTVFAFASRIPPAPVPDKSKVTPYSVITAEDMRWQRCNIKSTSLLGNVMHYQTGQAGGHDETILYNPRHELTEAAACNVYVVKDGVLATPSLDEQKLPGVTRRILLEILRRNGSIPLEERIVTLQELQVADEVWLTSSSKEIIPVLTIDDTPVSDGKIGDVWLAAQTLYSSHKFDF